MAWNALTSVDFAQFNTTEEVLDSLDKELVVLSNIALATDFNDSSHASQFYRNVMFIKGYFERYERLIRDGSSNA